MKMNRRKVGIGLLIVIIGIQFIRPNKPVIQQATLDDIILFNKPTDEVKRLLKNACYDCHSNETKSYWYSNIAPLAWIIDKDISQGRNKLNFSNWEKNTLGEKIELAGEIMHQMYEGGMPLKEYVIMHSEANLSKKEKNKITNWINSLID
ncbi:MAG: hypothetical protein COA38_13460 [Fluviicola sp.]|nr:MAG: hypothetical protein COA38_13460 [Fluviicola sp.]